MGRRVDFQSFRGTVTRSCRVSRIKGATIDRVFEIRREFITGMVESSVR